jgi:hypothetical protein
MLPTKTGGARMRAIRGGMGLGRLLALVAAIIFAVAAVGEWPSDLQDDVEPVGLGLAFLAASFVVP